MWAFRTGSPVREFSTWPSMEQRSFGGVGCVLAGELDGCGWLEVDPTTPGCCAATSTGSAKRAKRNQFIRGSRIEYMTYGTAAAFTASLLEPFIQMPAHEIILIQIRIGSVDPAEFFQLARGKIFGWVQTPPAQQQPLPPQHFVNTRDAARGLVGHVE